MSDQNPQEPEIVIPDTADFLTARDYRKTAQKAAVDAHMHIDRALYASAGRQGLSEEEKIKHMEAFKAELEQVVQKSSQALDAITYALNMAGDSNG